MWEFLKENSFIVGALSGSLAAYLLGLLVSHLRREKRWLGYSIDSRNIVKAGHSGVSMMYERRDIQRLDSHTVLLRNIGNRPLTNLPVRVVTNESAQIVEQQIKGPEGATFTATLPKESELLVTCDLLNPGEVASVGLTIADSTDGDIKVLVRAEGLTVKRIDERSTTNELLKLLLSSSSVAGMLIRAVSILTVEPRQKRR